MNNMIAIRDVRGLGFTRQEVLKRGDKLTREGSPAFAHFAYIADDGRIATQESGELPILHDAGVFGLTVYAPFGFSNALAMLEKVCNRAVPAGTDSTGQDMVKMRAALLAEARAVIAAARDRASA